MATTKITLKILVDKKANRVLFAEAGKDFVDFLFSLLSLPVGSVIRLLTKNNMVGCVRNLYRSVEGLDDTYIINPKTNKKLLLEPKAASAAPLNVPLLTGNEGSVNTGNYYTCGNNIPSGPTSSSFPFGGSSSSSPTFSGSTSSGSYFGGATYSYSRHFYVTTDPNTKCPGCKCNMTTQLTYIASETEVGASPSGDQKGYVKGVVTYMIMDDLTVKPMSTISSITLLNKFNVGDLSLLEEKVVDFGMDEGLELLKISLQSNTALSEVFLGKKSESEVYGVKLESKR